MEQTTILVVEDEKKMARLLQLELEHEGFTVDVKYDGLDALEAFYANSYQLILLDVMLPSLSGMELLRRIRKQDAHVPVMLLTARDAVPDKVSGFDLGATDYMTKPFEIEELLARIRAHLRHTVTAAAVQDTVLQVGDLTLDEKTRTVIRGKMEIELTPREYDLLLFLMKHEKQVLTRDQLLERVWGFQYAGDTNVVDVYIRYLRKKIDTGERRKLIKTVRGVGYTIKDEEK
ncbi:DNA-binding response regulator [Terribacillus saccharophilus]|uniref:DNA-binding response regulator n=1 Tax=Terribacillus saccharophilus TaxID=361277 RepID=A0A268HD55_9BACI|nr:response regulator transcription factor [Terribacillus saccharophilus]PAD36623.1 DNA-binding response regulator [Terribacillus saccharophilus]PAD97605.1 DNA-binding response regulator [Terribacillus saccharophilus]PAE01652.1 DNA-binding response regulator [Terribacillus saccharophilus]PAE07805.1 DNA-binding response regulator [Terribacillus saccharophilus]